jgi:transposase
MGQATRVVLTHDERTELEGWLRKSSTRRSHAERARIVLLAADGLGLTAIADKLESTRPRVTRWRDRFLSERIAGLVDRPRPGQPRRLSSKQAQEILRRTVSEIPHEATHWSLRLMAKYAGVSQWHVAQVWEAADLKPHRLKNFKISADPEFAEKVTDVVGLYLNPPTNAVVLSVDEKTQIQALDRTQPMLQLRPGQIERRTHDYKRHGTASLYAAFDISTGKVLGKVTDKHRAADFLSFLTVVDRSVAPKLDLHLILDNSSTHKTPEVKSWLEAHPRFQLHFTPTSASWLNAVEGWFAQLERRAIYRGVFTSVAALRQELRRFIAAHNKHSAKPFRWTRSAESLIASHERVRASNGINSAGH